MRCKSATESITIALVGKYIGLHDAYLSVAESLCHAGIYNDVKVDIKWINSEDVTPVTVEEQLLGCSGILVPGGFGDRGIPGMIEAVKYARENKIPYFGICLGMQMAVIEYARNVCGIKDAHSSEFNKDTQNPVIDLMLEQKSIDN